MFPGAATPEIPSGNNDRIIAIHLALFNKGCLIDGFRQAAKSVAAQFVVFFLYGGNEIQVLRRNNLVCINVIPHHKHLSANARTHTINVQ